MHGDADGGIWGHECLLIRSTVGSSVSQHRATARGRALGANTMRNNGIKCAMQRANKEPKALSFSDFRPALVCWRGFFGAVFRHLSAWMPCFGTVQ